MSRAEPEVAPQLHWPYTTLEPSPWSREYCVKTGGKSFGTYNFEARAPVSRNRVEPIAN